MTKAGFPLFSYSQAAKDASETSVEGSEAATEALRRWREEHGKLSADFVRTARMRNAGLATSAALPYGGAIPPVIKPPVISSGQEEASGGGLSSLAGMLGRRFTGAAGIGYALHKATEGLREWLSHVGRLTEASRAFDAVANSVDSLQAKERMLVEHNRDFALSYAQIERQVNTTALQIAHLTQVQEVQLTFQKRVADAKMEAELAESALRNRFNPIGQIQDEMDIRERAFTRQMEQEKALRQIELERHESTVKRAAEREERYAKEAEAIKALLPALERQADLDAKKTEKLAGEGAVMKERLEKQRAAVQEFAENKYTTFDAAAYVSRHPTEKLSGALLNPLLFDVPGIATEKLGALDEALSDINKADNKARGVSRASAARLSRALKKLGYAEGEVTGAESERQRAGIEAGHLRGVIDLENQSRPTILQQQIEAERSRGTLDILNVSPTHIPPTGGGASISNDAQSIIAAMERLWAA